MDAVLNRVSSPTFVGRADELAALDGALGRAAAGVPAFTFVAGESGVGKSRLVAELEARARYGGRARASSATASSWAGPPSPTPRWSTRCARSPASWPSAGRRSPTRCRRPRAPRSRS